MSRIFQHTLRRLKLLGFWLLAGACYAQEPVVIAVNEDILPDYSNFLHSRDLQSIQNYSGTGARRDVVELVLLQQALYLGGFTQPVKLQAEQSYLRAMRDIGDGRYITSAGLAWHDDIHNRPGLYYESRPLVKDGEFIVGVYTSPHNLRTLGATDLTALSQLTAVTSSQWKVDVKTLAALKIERVIYSPSWTNMARMLDADRADFTLAPFQATADMSVNVSGVKLVPVPGIKIALAGSRHWPVSRKHPQGNAFYEALERGLAQMESKGTIQRAYRECGFFSPEVAQWKLLQLPVVDKISTAD